MVKRGYKLIICVVLVVTLFVGFCSAFASAESAIVTRVKAGVAAAMLAAQLVITPVDVITSEPIASGIDPEGRLEWVETFPEYLERSKIRVYPDVVTIDGVPYTDIWLGPDAANSLRLKGLDFATAYNIANNQSSAVSYASGVGYIDNNIPVYLVNGIRQSPEYVFSQAGGSNGTWSYSTTGQSGSVYWGEYTLIPTGQVASAVNQNVGTDRYTQVRNQNNHYYVFYKNTYGVYNAFLWQIDQLFSEQSFSFDYTSGVIDAPLDPEDGLLMRIPSSYTGSTSQDSYDIHDLVNVYPDTSTSQGHTIEINPELNPDFQTDIDLGNDVGDLIRTILTILDLLDNVDIEFAPEPDTPEPVPEPGTIDPLPDPDPAPDVPSSGTTIADTDWTKLDEILRWIQSTIDSIRHITESLQTMLDSLFDQLQNIIESLEALPEQLLEDIETGPSKVFRKALDVLKSLFLPLLLPIKAMMCLWHYVVEWIASINAPFLWIFGVMSGTSANMVLPIYAVLAGSICIAIYKALGR